MVLPCTLGEKLDSTLSTDSGAPCGIMPSGEYCARPSLQSLHIEVEFAGVIILGHLRRDFLRRMRVHPLQRLDEHVDDLLRGLLVGFHPAAVHVEAGGGIIAAERRARRFRRAQVDADFRGAGLTARATVGSVVMPETILPCCIAARNVSPAPTGTSV